MWRWFAVAVLVVSAAVAASTARTAERSATAFSRCSEVLSGGQATTAPDGSLVYAYGYHINSVRPDGSHDRTLYTAAEPLRFPAVSPDGRLIAFDKGDTLQEVWVMNSDGSGAHFVASGTSPAFSPDGSHLAIGGAPTPYYHVDLDVIGVDGSGRRTLATDALSDPRPAWSPDGRTIVFNGVQFATYLALKAINPDGTGERVFAGGQAASWSTDGREVVYSQPGYDEIGAEVDVINADGSGFRHLVRPVRGFDANSPTWSRDGKKVTYDVSPIDAYPYTEGVFWQVDATGRGRHPLASDCRFGTGGADRIHGTPRRDTIYALEGNDTIDVRRGGRDFVDCGRGRDVVRADRRDVIAGDCERRLR